MLVAPAIDLMDGKCVQLVEGKPWSAKVVIDDAVATAVRWQSLGAKRLHVIDLDAALGNGDNEQVIKKILAAMTSPGKRNLYPKITLIRLIILKRK